MILLDGEDATPYNIANEASDVTIRGFAKKACEVFPEKSMKLVFADPADEAEPQETVTPLRQVPELIFEATDSIEYSANISRILHSLDIAEDGEEADD